MKFRNPKTVKSKYKYIKSGKRHIPLLILQPKERTQDLTAGILWLHGGGYFIGMKEMAYINRAVDVVDKFGVTVVLPGYRLSWQSPFPAAINDCYEALIYLKNNCHELGINPNQIAVAGESAGGGLAAAISMMARDKGEIKLAFQLPLYPMLDNFDTQSSKNNHGRVWNTRRNHLGWWLYLRGEYKNTVSPYAAPARQTDYSMLPPAYTFIGTGEPFYCETIEYIENLKKAGVEARVDIYDTNIHAFDMMMPNLEISKIAIKKFDEEFQYMLNTYFTE